MKQSTRIKLLSIIFLITGIGAVLILWKGTGFGNSDANGINVSVDSSSLNKITLRYNDQTTVLTKVPLKWMVNGKYKASSNLIQLIIVGLSKAEVKRPVAEENKKRVIEFLKQKGIQVKVEGTDWNKKFLIYTNENDVNSSYFLEEGNPEPYIIYVPGFSGDMTNIFKKSEADWRSRILFTSTPTSLQKIAVSYPAYKTSNVEIIWNADRTFKVAGINKVDTAKVYTYLSQFEEVNVDNYVYKDKEAIMTEIRKNAPVAILEMTDLDASNNHKLSIYNESKDPKGIYAIVEPQNELVVMNPKTLFRILVRKEFFEKK